MYKKVLGEWNESHHATAGMTSSDMLWTEHSARLERCQDNRPQMFLALQAEGLHKPFAGSSDTAILWRSRRRIFAPVTRCQIFVRHLGRVHTLRLT